MLGLATCTAGLDKSGVQETMTIYSRYPDRFRAQDAIGKPIMENSSNGLEIPAIYISLYRTYDGNAIEMNHLCCTIGNFPRPRQEDVGYR
jgi:hypothetical protein